MGSVTLYVDYDNFTSFMKKREFSGWADKSEWEYIQISVPVAAIATYEKLDEGLKFDCFKAEVW